MTPTADTLCLACGLCCSGAMFGAVPVAPDEDVPAVLEDGHLPLPCACLDGTACTIYADRPAACRAFSCHVLDALRDGVREGDWALHRIATLRTAIAALEAVLPGDAPSLYTRVTAFKAKHRDALHDKGFRKAHGPLLHRLWLYEEALSEFRTLER